jgi:hypothetical protein
VKSNGQVKTVDRGPPSRIQKKIDHGETKSDSYSIMADDGHEDALDVLEDFSGPSIKPRRKSAPLTDSGDEDPNRTLINFQIFSRLPPEIQTCMYSPRKLFPNMRLRSVLVGLLIVFEGRPTDHFLYS